MSWPGWSQTGVANPGSKPGGPCRQSNRPMEPPPSVTSAAGLTRFVWSLAAGAECAREDSNLHDPQGSPAPRAGAYPVPPRTRAATRGRTGPSAVRKRSRKPCAAAKLGYQASNLENSRVRAGRVCLFPHIPLSAEGAIRTHRPRGLGSRGLPVAVTSAYAAGDSNPELTD